MITNFLRRLRYNALGSLLLLGGLIGCENNSGDGLLQFSDDNLLLKAAGDTVIIHVTAEKGWKAESQAKWCMV